MAQKTRPIHRGVTISALEDVMRTKQPVKLAGCLVLVLAIQSGEPGCYFVMVSGQNSTSTYWINVTSCDHERLRDRASKIQSHRIKQENRSSWA